MKALFATFLLLTFLAITACSDEKTSPENEIKQYIENGKIAAEKRSHSDLADLIDESYKDQRGWNRQDIEKVARAYFFTHKNIHLLTKIDSTDFQNKNSAFVVLHVAMAGNVIADLNSLSSLRARIYKFELQLVKNDVWLLQQAKWQVANIKDML
ncbi:MAG: hypothetical protein OQK98_13250 [Gammaproteobacteria bacterium]|nr:hypothetical protein [Gammaproteobacteria bacterium]